MVWIPGLKHRVTNQLISDKIPASVRGFCYIYGILYYMQKASITRIVVAGALVCASFAFLVAEVTSAQSTACPAGQRLATADDVTKGLATTVGVSCVDSATADKLNGGCSFDPYPVVNSFRANTAVLLTPQINSSGAQNGINPILACRVAQFLQYAKSQGHPLLITSGFRTAQQQTAACENICHAASCPGTCAPAGTSCHQYGLAVDVSGTATDLAWARSYLGVGAPAAGASTYRVFFPIKSGSDIFHLQCVENPVAGCNASTVGCGGGNFQITGAGPAGGGAATNPLQGLAQLLGLNNGQQCQAGYTMVNGTCTLSSLAGPQPGQIVSQNTVCVISTNPPITQIIPAGSIYPAGCINTQTTNSTQPYCSGNTIVSNSTGIPITVQTCQYGCSNGACMQQQAQQPSSASNQGTSGTTAANQTSGTSGSTNASTVTSPNLVTSLLTPSSTIAILSALANPQNATTSATTTPIVLNSAVANSIAQLQAVAPPGVTYAIPTSAYFPPNGNGQQTQTGTTPSQTQNNNGATDNGSGITTTPGTGYDMTNGSDAGTGASPATSGIASTPVQSGVETFPPTDSGTNANTQGSYEAASTFNSGPLSALAVLKAEVISAINFLQVYIQPFGGNVPSQMVGD